MTCSRFGTKKLTELLAPAIEYAESGFPVSEIIAGGWGSSAQSLRRGPTRPRPICPMVAPRKRGDLSAIPTLRTATAQSPSRGATPFTGVTSRGRSWPSAESPRRLFHGGRLRRSHVRLDRAGLDQLSRLRRVGTAAERPGHRCAAKCSTCSKLSTCAAWGPASRTGCTCLSRPRSWRTTIGRSSMPIPNSTACLRPS